MLPCKCIVLTVSAALLAVTAARADIRTDIQAAKSGTTITCSGTYTVTNKIVVPSGVTVKGPATFIFSSSGSDGFSVATGSTGVTLQSLTVTGANHGFMLLGNNSKVISCNANGNHNSGFQFSASGSYNNTFSACISYNNADSTGGNADGFSAKNGTSTGNQILNCTAYSNSDDGLDFYGGKSPITVTGCLVYNNGAYSGLTGNGDGFKMGGAGVTANHIFTSCVSHNNTAGDSGRGFNHNHNGGVITLTTCHSYSNKKVDVLTGDTLNNCTMQQ